MSQSEPCVFELMNNIVGQSKRQPKFFWVSAMAPLTSVILGSVLVYFTHAEKHGVQVVSILTLSESHQS